MRHILFTLSTLFSFNSYASEVPSCINFNSFQHQKGCQISKGLEVKRFNSTKPGEKSIFLIRGFRLHSSLKTDISLLSHQSYFQKIKKVNGVGLITTLQRKGYDVYLVKFPNNSANIQTNGAHLSKVITTINQKKDYRKGHSIIGFSMGGMIARYSLLDLESKNIGHNVNAYVSYDSPHMGANLPVETQLAYKALEKGFLKLADKARDVSKLPFVGVKDPSPMIKKQIQQGMALFKKNFDSPVVKELALEHYRQSPSLGGNGRETVERTILKNKLKTLGGFPKTVKKIAISNSNPNILQRGNDIKRPLTYRVKAQPIKRGSVYFAMDLNNNNGNAELNQRMSMFSRSHILFRRAKPKSNMLAKSSLKINSIPGSRYKSLVKDASKTDPKSRYTPSHPVGGVLLALDKYFSEGLKAPKKDIRSHVLEKVDITFIPTYSALGLRDNHLLNQLKRRYGRLTENILSRFSPFDAVILQNLAQDRQPAHLEINQEILDKILKEIEP